MKKTITIMAATLSIAALAQQAQGIRATRQTTVVATEITTVEDLAKIDPLSAKEAKDFKSARTDMKRIKRVQLWEDGPYWADRNVGAETPFDPGYYFWWGDTVGYKRVGDKWVASDGSNDNFEFSKDNCSTYGKKINELSPSQDAASVHLGNEWRMPTRKELEALSAECDWEWTTIGDTKGCKVKGRGAFAGSSIFLPAAGYGNGTSLSRFGEKGYFWSSEPRLAPHRWAYYSYFDNSEGSEGFYSTCEYRYRGFPVRPVGVFAK